MAVKQNLKLSISFKQTKKDLALYKVLMSLEDRSHDIKQVLYNVLVLKNSTLNDNILHNIIAPSEVVDEDIPTGHDAEEIIHGAEEFKKNTVTEKIDITTTDL